MRAAHTQVIFTPNNERRYCRFFSLFLPGLPSVSHFRYGTETTGKPSKLATSLGLRIHPPRLPSFRHLTYSRRVKTMSSRAIVFCRICGMHPAYDHDFW